MQVVNGAQIKMKLWNKLAQDIRVIAILMVTNLAQLIIIIGLIICLAIMPTRFTFHIPPDLSNGVTLQANKIPRAYVGQFAFYIWQAVNNWQTSGEQDAPTNLQKYGAYLSPSFKYYLTKDDERLKGLGELQSRVRVIRPMPGQEPQVLQIDSDTWQVNLAVRDSEYVNGILVKDKEIEYPFKVIRYNGNAQSNPFGLVLDDFIGQPQVLSTLK